MLKGKMFKIVLPVGIAVCLSSFTQMGFGQTVQTLTDKNSILIGEQIQLKVKADLPLNTKELSRWLVLPESIGHFDIVEKGKIDTIRFKDNSRALEQVITITSFDSGRWVFPSLPVEFRDAAGQDSMTLFTDSFYVHVSYSPADSSNQLRDIKPIIKVSVRDYFWYYIIGGALVLLLIAFLLYRRYRNKKADQTLPTASSLSPFEEAMETLKKLELYDLQDAAELKHYHIGLAAVFKQYLGRTQNKNLLNKTTGDLLINSKDLVLSPDKLSDLATALRCTDAVKFARYLPPSTESNKCLDKIKETINVIEGAKPANSKPLT